VDGVDGGTLLEYAALAESGSTHPIARSLLAARGGEADPTRIAQVEEIGGEGVTALVDGVRVAAGNARLLARLGLEAPAACGVGSVVYVALDGRYAGQIRLTDPVKPGAAEAIADLRQLGVRRTVMLTGDARGVAEDVAKQLGVDAVHSELLPGDKVRVLEALLEDAAGAVAFVGDGINDAPVLSRADVGIAMGAMGSDAAIEAADVVLMDDDPAKLAQAIRLARRCLRIVRQNVWFALTVKFVCLALGALKLLNMWWAIFADVGVMVLAVLNAMRALQTAEKRPKKKP
jgi:Cd2+/Zn2+-exporting ATPase